MRVYGGGAPVQQVEVKFSIPAQSESIAQYQTGLKMFTLTRSDPNHNE